jgi:hypothetical protein
MTAATFIRVRELYLHARRTQLDNPRKKIEPLHFRWKLQPDRTVVVPVFLIRAWMSLYQQRIRPCNAVDVDVSYVGS